MGYVIDGGKNNTAPKDKEYSSSFTLLRSFSSYPYEILKDMSSIVHRLDHPNFDDNDHIRLDRVCLEKSLG